MMKRNYTREEYVRTAAALKAGVRNLKLSTDFIVGFPGETEADFEQTLSLVKQVRFSLAFCFKYSPRSGTESSGFADDVSRITKEERLARLLQVVERTK
jgi:tRNA-2-methylthio-N6-dimethylallyladenosine synthase